MRNRDKQPQAGSGAVAASGRHHPAAALQRDVRGRPADRGGLRASTTRASCSKSRCSTTRPTRRAASPRWRSAGSPAEGFDIKYLHRSDRTGYKAGALEAGLKVARGEFVAIFDADFLPTADFLTKLMPHFARPEGRHGAGALGPHQPRLLAAHQDPGDPARRPLRARARRAQPRRAASSTSTAPPASGAAPAIDDAGGWQHDTLTEDLDLSYRAQLRGWQFVFVPDVIAPAEVPVEMNAFKSQQHRWAKGSIQTCRKLLPQILRAERAARRQGGGVLPPHRQLQLPADVRALGPDVPVHGDPLQHGLVRDAAHRRAAVLRGHLLGLQLLHGLPARDSLATGGPG